MSINLQTIVTIKLKFSDISIVQEVLFLAETYTFYNAQQTEKLFSEDEDFVARAISEKEKSEKASEIIADVYWQGREQLDPDWKHPFDF